MMYYLIVIPNKYGPLEVSSPLTEISLNLPPMTDNIIPLYSLVV